MAKKTKTSTPTRTSPLGKPLFLSYGTESDNVLTDINTTDSRRKFLMRVWDPIDKGVAKDLNQKIFVNMVDGLATNFMIVGLSYHKRIDGFCSQWLR
jgi:hypothetical protein